MVLGVSRQVCRGSGVVLDCSGLGVLAGSGWFWVASERSQVVLYWFFGGSGLILGSSGWFWVGSGVVQAGSGLVLGCFWVVLGASGWF